MVKGAHYTSLALGSNAQCPHEKLGTAMHACDPALGAELFGLLAELKQLSLVRDPVLRQ